MAWPISWASCIVTYNTWTLECSSRWTSSCWQLLFTDTGWLDTTMVCCQVWSVNTFQSLYKYGLFGSGKLGQLLCAIPARRSRWERRRARYKGLYDRGGNTLLERSSSRFHMRFHWLRFSDALLRSIFWLLFVYHSTAAQSILCG